MPRSPTQTGLPEVDQRRRTESIARAEVVAQAEVVKATEVLAQGVRRQVALREMKVVAAVADHNVE